MSNVSLVSDYRFRGISQTMRRPAIQGGFDYSHANGFYSGAWASNVDGTNHFYNNTSMELDVYGGFKGNVFPCSQSGFSYNIGLIYYYFPGGETNLPNSVRYNTGEINVEWTYKWLCVKYSQAFTNYFGTCSDDPPFDWEKNRADRSNGSSIGSNYIEASAKFDLYKENSLPYFSFKLGKLTLFLHVGHLMVRHYGQLSYTDWQAMLVQEFEWLNVFMSYVGTNARHAFYDVPDHASHPKNRHLGAQGVILGVKRIF